MGKPAGWEPARTQDGGLSRTAGPLNTIKVGVDLKHELQMCSSGLHRPGVAIRSSSDQPETLQITRKFLSKSYVGVINREEMQRLGPLNSPQHLLRDATATRNEKEAHSPKLERVADIRPIARKTGHKLRPSLQTRFLSCIQLWKNFICKV